MKCVVVINFPAFPGKQQCNSQEIPVFPTILGKTRVFRLFANPGNSRINFPYI